MNQIVVTGMILSSTPIGEYDKRIVILTKEHGKLSAFAKGARRPNSPLVGAVNPFSFGKFTMYEGRTSYTVQSVEISNYFMELRSDMLGAYYGFYFLELANYYTKEFNDEKQVLKLLYQTMRALINPHIPNRLVRCIYELKIICLNGEGPQVFECVKCGAKDCSVKFSSQAGGLVCEECLSTIKDGMIINHSTLYALQFVVSSTVEKLYTFTVKEDVLIELEKVMKQYLAAHISKEFHSIEMIEVLGTS